MVSKITVSDHSAFRLFIPEPDAFFVRKMLKFIIIFHFVSTLYYELVKERHNKRPKEVPTSFECFQKSKRCVRTWKGGFPVLKVFFRITGVGFRRTRVDSVYKRWISDKKVFFRLEGWFSEPKRWIS